MLKLYSLLVHTDAEGHQDPEDGTTADHVPRNFVLLLFSYLFTKTGDAIVNPKTMLAWLVSGTGAPAAVVGMLVPVRESGSLLPQLVLSGLVQSRPLRKWIWVTGAVCQGLAVMLIGLIALEYGGARAGVLILAALAAFALSRALCSIAAKEVLGKTIPQGQRGQLTGWSTSVAGLVGLGVGLVLLLFGGELKDTRLLAMLIMAVGTFWLVAAALYGQIREQPSAPDGEANDLAAVGARLAMLRRDAVLRDFVLARGLFLCTALSTPYVVLLGQANIGRSAVVLGSFIVAEGVASMVGAPVWGRLADRSAKTAMRLGAGLAALVGGAVVACAGLAPALLTRPWLLPAAYFLLAVAHAGVRVGRKTYVVDIAGDDRRADYVAVSNSVIGVLLLLTGLVGLLEARIGLAGVLGVLALMGGAGAVYGARLPEATSR